MSCTCHRIVGRGCDPSTGESGLIYAPEPDCTEHGINGTPEPWSVIAEAVIDLHKDDPHRCQAQLLAPRPRNEGDTWTCPECGASWTLKRSQEVSPAVRLNPTRRWVQDQ